MAKQEQVKKKTSIGGQALIEGIMMRGPEKTSMAVRHVSGEIVTEEWATTGQNRAKIWKLPLFRGVYNFIDSMIFGYRCLMRSAELAGLEDDDGEKKEKAKETEAAAETAASPETPGAEVPLSVETETVVSAGEEPPAEPEPEEKCGKDDAEKKEGKEEGFWEKFGMTLLMVLSSVLGVVLAIGLFIYLPALLFNLLTKPFPALNHQVWRAIFEGVLRIALFVGYIAAVSLMKDIRRVFQFHGAEHKCIFCYEKGLPLTVENVRRQIRFHPRCGTSFMILMLIVGIVISMFITVTNPVLRTGIKLLTIPLVVGIGYELIKLAGRSDALIVRIISAPGLWLQRVTTKEPTDDRIEGAITARNMVIPEDPEADRL